MTGETGAFCGCALDSKPSWRLVPTGGFGASATEATGTAEDHDCDIVDDLANSRQTSAGKQQAVAHFSLLRSEFAFSVCGLPALEEFSSRSSVWYSPADEKSQQSARRVDFLVQ